METVRFGLIGAGGMGTAHAKAVRDGVIGRCELTAVADSNPERLALFDEGIRKFTDGSDLIRSRAADAVLIATPHYSHTTYGIAALEKGLHVLVEKPISVHKADAERLIAAHRDRRQVFAAMFNQRTDPHYREIKGLIERGELGPLARVSWTVTSWFRPDAYYAAGGWRATWKGEGGGVLLNQCPHQLDLLQWLCGMPRKVWGFCGLGKRHKIEVEDEVTAYLEYDGGATGTFVTSTGEAPGTNRLEIAGDMGKVVVEDSRVVFWRNEVSAEKFRRTTKEMFAQPKAVASEIPVSGSGGQHVEIMKNFVAAILDGVPLIAPAEEGIRSVELANAMLYSSLTGGPVSLPLDGAAYERMLNKLVAGWRPTPAKR